MPSRSRKWPCRPRAARRRDRPALVGKSQAMVEVYKLIGRFAKSDDAVLILGETGTGKELVARAIHTNSPRKAKPFVALNCTALNENLLDDELFGHEPGAFTGADKLRKGKFEYANGGTLFLDEIGDMPLNLQAKLLRRAGVPGGVRIGSNEAIKVERAAAVGDAPRPGGGHPEGRFRRDLFYRLNRVTIRLPPLRERVDDLAELAAYFVTQAINGSGRPAPSLAESTLQRLRLRLARECPRVTERPVSCGRRVPGAADPAGAPGLRWRCGPGAATRRGAAGGGGG